jgi:predicted dehydrogenase
LTQAQPDGAETLRIAMVGTGRWAGPLALDAAQTPGVELVACFDTDADAARRFAAEFDVRAASSLEEIVSDPEVGAGVACVPNSRHREVAVALAGAGKHVFVPRPIANFVKPAKEMVAAAKSAGVVLFVDHSSSFGPEVEAMFDAVQSGRAGKVFGGHAMRSANWEKAGGREWHVSPRDCPGGPATLLGVSAAATLIRFLGRPVAVKGSMTAGLVPGRVPNVTTFLIEHESGAHSTLVASGVSAVPNDHLYFYGMQGVIMSGPTIAHAGPRAILAEAGSRVLVELDSRGRRERGMGMFVEAVRTGAEPRATTRLALDALATIEAGLRSVAENRRVTLAETLDG